MVAAMTPKHSERQADFGGRLDGGLFKAGRKGGGVMETKMGGSLWDSVTPYLITVLGALAVLVAAGGLRYLADRLAR